MVDINAKFLDQTSQIPNQVIQEDQAKERNLAALSQGIPDSTEGFLAPAAFEVDRPPQNDPNQDIYITNWNTFKQSFKDAGAQGLPAQIYKSARNFSDQYIFNSDILTQDEVKGMQKNRPGVVFPKGVNRNLANDIANDYDSKKVRDELLAHSKPTFGGKASSFLGSAIGSIVTDPISTGIAAGAGIATKDVYAIPEMLGLERQWIKIALGRAAQGAVEGGAFGLSQAAGQSLEKISSGDTLDGVAALQNIGDSAFLGGLLHPIGGKFADLLKGNKAFEERAAEDATQSAAQMMANGKDPDPSLSLRNGFNLASKRLKRKIEKRGIDPLEVNEQLIRRGNEIDEQLRTETDPGKIQSLQQERRSVDVHKALLDNAEEEIPKTVFDEYVNKNMISSSDFANGLGQSELDVAGPDVKSGEDLLNDRFPEEERQRLLDERELSDGEREEFESFDKFEKNTPKMEGGINTLIRCITGAVR